MNDGAATFVIIPPTVLCDPRLSAGEKMVYGRVFGFIKAHGYCNASNDYIGQHIGMSKNTVRNYLSRLYDLGYLRYEVIRSESKEILERRIYPTLVPPEVLPSTTPRTRFGTEEVNIRSKKNVNSKREETKVPRNVDKSQPELSEREVEYYAGLLADILSDAKSISYYKAVVRRFDPHRLIEKAKAILSGRGCQKPPFRLR